MTTINDLTKSITERPRSEVVELVKTLRFSRRTQKESNKKATKKAVAKKSRVINVANALSMLTDEQKAALAKELFDA